MKILWWNIHRVPENEGLNSMWTMLVLYCKVLHGLRSAIKHECLLQSRGCHWFNVISALQLRRWMCFRGILSIDIILQSNCHNIFQSLNCKLYSWKVSNNFHAHINKCFIRLNSVRNLGSADGFFLALMKPCSARYKILSPVYMDVLHVKKHLNFTLAIV